MANTLRIHVVEHIKVGAHNTAPKRAEERTWKILEVFYYVERLFTLNTLSRAPTF